MNLKICKRVAQGQSKNQFVKLNNSTVQQLFSEAWCQYNAENLEANGWNLHDEDVNNVQFLPLSIECWDGTEKQYLYCSYNGGMCDEGKNLY